jgi:hypothetical protein
MRLPPLDTYRLPLVEPIGHLAMQAAYLDNDLIEFISMLLPFGRDTTPDQVAHEMRNWNATFLDKAIDDAIGNPALAVDLHAFVKRVGDLREERHRMIHDAMEVGIDQTPGGGYGGVLLREGYVRKDKKTTHRVLEYVTPEQVAALAYQFYDARLEIDGYLGRLYDAGGIVQRER